jgi:hypothetical protein
MLAIVAFVILASRITHTPRHFFDVVDQPKHRVTPTGPHLRNTGPSPVCSKLLCNFLPHSLLPGR